MWAEFDEVAVGDHPATLRVCFLLGVDHLQQLATQLQRSNAALEGTCEQTSKDVLDRPFYGAFCHIHRLLAQPVGLVAKGR